MQIAQIPFFWSHLPGFFDFREKLSGYLIQIKGQ